MTDVQPSVVSRASEVPRDTAGGADDGELRAGDVIYAVNGVSVLGLSELRAARATLEEVFLRLTQEERP